MQLPDSSSMLRFLAVTALCIGIAGCSGDKSATANAATTGKGAGGGAAKRSGRPTPSVTLAPTDYLVVSPTTIEDGAALTGDLRPIETIDVRARIEGDLTGVYAREGQQVGAGQVLASFEASEQESSRASAEADVAAARSDLANASWTLEQDASLFKAGAIAERDYKNAQQAVTSSRARLAAAQARARTSGNQARDTRVVAPASGIVEKRLVEAGEHVARGAQLFSLVRNGTLELAAAVPERQSRNVRTGQTVHFVADGQQFNGRVARMSPTIDPSTRAVTVYVEIPNPGGVLRGGTFATGRVVSRTLTNVIAIPNAAIRQSAQSGKAFVYRIDGQTLNIAPISVGIVDERLGLAQITDGLKAGDRIIVGNLGTLGAGMKVLMAGEDKPRRK